MNKWIELARCTKAHGIKGGFYLHLHNPDSDFIQKGRKVIVTRQDDEKEYTVSQVQYGNKTICYFKGIEDRNAIEDLLPFTVKVLRSQLDELEEGEFYLTDLVGLKVFDQFKKEIGKIKSFYDNGAQPVIEIQTKASAIELPFVDAFFKEVDLEKGEVHIINPEVIE